MLYELTAIDFSDEDDRDRAGERVNVPHPARVIVGEHDAPDTQGALTAHLVNLSDGGAALRIYGRLDPGDHARLMIDVGCTPLVISVRAVWTRSLPEGRIVGVIFERMTGAQAAWVARLIADHVA
jgi:hypothetical protein